MVFIVYAFNQSRKAQFLISEPKKQRKPTACKSRGVLLAASLDRRTYIEQSDNDFVDVYLGYLVDPDAHQGK
jgi:hypothetical protein